VRVKKIENVSKESVQVELEDGSKLDMLPGARFENLRIKNVFEIKDKVKLTSDLGEINENCPGPIKLYD